MASFEQHVNGAVITSGVLVNPLYLSHIVDINQSLALFAFGILGGVLPDIDSDNSKPIQISFRILSIFLPLIIVLTLVHTQSLLIMLSSWVLVALVFNFVIFKSFLHITLHRGVFHSIPMGILLGYASILFLKNIMGYDALFSTLCGAFLFIGFIVHLLMDEFISLNALGLHVKKSFGTAFKFYDRKNLYGTAIIYITLVILVFLYPVHTDIFLKLFDSFKTIKL